MWNIVFRKDASIIQTGCWNRVAMGITPRKPAYLCKSTGFTPCNSWDVAGSLLVRWIALEIFMERTPLVHGQTARYRADRLKEELSLARVAAGIFLAAELSAIAWLA